VRWSPAPALPFGRAPRAATATTSASCVLTPAKTEGPYFVDERLERSDIRAGQAGVPLTLKLIVLDQDGGCAPVAGAQVDIWHANHSGQYSDEAANGTSGQTYLRGYQITDDQGAVTFTTIYPGWYRGRAVHIHSSSRTRPAPRARSTAPCGSRPAGPESVAPGRRAADG
jgi:protocatechuate 3,4-dioxygenase beta subunit